MSLLDAIRFRITLICIFGLFTVFVLKSQDSTKNPKLRLFDVQLSCGVGGLKGVNVTKNNVGNYTSHKEYVSDEFMADYSDTSRSRYRPRKINPDVETAATALFQFHKTKSKLLRRLKPRLGLDYSKSTLFRYNLGSEKYIGADTFYYADPSYPPLIEKRYVSGSITYEYVSRSISTSLGFNFDVIQHKYIIIYAGLMYGFGIGKGSFSVTKVGDDSVIRETFRENMTFNSRYFFPIGILLRARTEKNRNLNFFIEVKPGRIFLKVNGGPLAKGSNVTLSAGLRLSLQPHK